MDEINVGVTVRGAKWQPACFDTPLTVDVLEPLGGYASAGEKEHTWLVHISGVGPEHSGFEPGQLWCANGFDLTFPDKRAVVAEQAAELLSEMVCDKAVPLGEFHNFRFAVILWAIEQVCDE